MTPASAPLSLIEYVSGWWPYVATATTLAFDLLASAHAVLYKRHHRAAALWIALIWMLPLVGACLYIVFGINRIQRRATQKRAYSLPSAGGLTVPKSSLDALAPALERDGPDHLVALARLVDKVVDERLTAGNRIRPLVSGDVAYPEMLTAIAEARRTVGLTTYIFDSDAAGKEFLAALSEAQGRGVEVRVIIDDIGARYSWPSSVSLLEAANIPVARFFPSFVPWRLPYANLRNHRKILVVDGRVGFTGGMNIRIGHLLGRLPSHPVQDLHFRLEGPVVAQLADTFVEDWGYCTGERLEGEEWFPALGPQGETIARGIACGPDERFQNLRWTLHGAIARAKHTIRIVTPYFLPDSGLITALNTASLSGVRVQIVLPSQNNLRLVKWASTALLWQLLERGCEIYLTPAPFDHTKLMVVDGAWVLFGSANWDPRSLRLNFEFNVEAYGTRLAGELDRLIDERLAQAHRLTLAEVDGRSLAVRLRDGVARLFTPLL